MTKAELIEAIGSLKANNPDNEALQDLEIPSPDGKGATKAVFEELHRDACALCGVDPDEDPDGDGNPDEGDGNPDAPFVVAKGKSVTCKKGIVGEGEAIAVKDISGGEERFNALCESGVIVANG